MLAAAMLIATIYTAAAVRNVQAQECGHCQWSAGGFWWCDETDYDYSCYPDWESCVEFQISCII